jgi:CRP-like cAMP-binding protein
MAADVTEGLLSCELFATLTKEEIEPVVKVCSKEAYQAGEKIFSQGEHGRKVYVISRGQVTLERTVDLGERTATITIATLGRGRAFGCWSSILGHPHNLMSSAVCSEPTHVISMNGAALHATLQEDPTVGFKVLEKLALLLGERLRGVYGAMEKL